MLPPETRARLILGFDYLRQARDEHFGNGRLVRNVFEHGDPPAGQSGRRHRPLDQRPADALGTQPTLSCPTCPNPAIGAEATRELSVNIVCPGCRNVSRLKATNLGRHAQCKKCQAQFTADWGEPVPRG